MGGVHSAHTLGAAACPSPRPVCSATGVGHVGPSPESRFWTRDQTRGREPRKTQTGRGQDETGTDVCQGKMSVDHRVQEGREGCPRPHRGGEGEKPGCSDDRALS